MTNPRHTLDDEETSVFTVVQQPAAPMKQAPPMPPVSSAPQPVPAPTFVPPAGQPATPLPLYPPAPGATPPTVMPPLYPASRPAGYGTSGRAVFAALLLTIFGFVEAAGGAVGAIAASTLRAVVNQLMRSQGIRIESASLTGILTALFLTLLLLGVLQLIAAGGIVGHKGWGRAIGLALSLAGTVAGSWLAYRAATGAEARTLVAPLVVLIPYAMSTLALLFPGDHFRRGGR